LLFLANSFLIVSFVFIRVIRVCCFIGASPPIYKKIYVDFPGRNGTYSLLRVAVVEETFSAVGEFGVAPRFFCSLHPGHPPLETNHFRADRFSLDE